MNSLRKKIGQMLIMGFDGHELHDQSPVAQWLSTDGLGGVLLFDKYLDTGIYGKNLRSKTQIKHLISQLNDYAAQGYDEDEAIPILTAIDYEGGAVDRLSKIEGCMPTMRAIDLARLNWEDFDDEINLMAQTLKSLGFNLNFAPVVDLNLNDQEGIIGSLGRSFSADPKIVSLIAERFIKLFSQHGLATSYKHFPGHGSAVGDTHEGFVDVTETFNEGELEPYDHLKDYANLPVMVMTAHVINRKLDASGHPATLSHKILTGLLRQRMGYDGIIISDDLQMRAIASHYDLKDALRLTINAGADMMIFGNQLGDNNAPEVIDMIEELVLNEEIPLARIEESYRRVMRLKQQIQCVEVIDH